MSELNLGAKLTALRLEKGVTQDDVANALDISNKTVSKWENGSSSPDIEMLVRISEYFGVSSD
ncbi:MAG: helix-turn-helix transcriptional regulator, partial [Clostridia bacterium]|nr:helix-turn-helix transcriptional regulator [Clostridia bacterium]